MNKIVFATGNTDKLRELEKILPDYEILTLHDIGFDGDIIEDGDSFEANALIKAKAAYEKSGLPAVADDSGLCVDALGGAPGIFSARYSGGDYMDNCIKLMAELKDVPKEKRTAQFVSAAAFYTDSENIAVRGTVSGHIGFEMKGEGGFGYDPLFIEDKTGLTYAQMSEEQKNSLSHRKLAFEALKEEIDSYF